MPAKLLNTRRNILFYLFGLFAIGGILDVLFHDPTSAYDIWDILIYVATAVLTWLWIRADQGRLAKPMYSKGFTWVVALLPHLAFAYHAFNSRPLIDAVLLIAAAIGLLISGSLLGGILATTVLSFLSGV